MEKEELLDILIAVVALGFVVSFEGFGQMESFLKDFPINTLIIGTAFIFHELAHRQTARRLGYFARFELWNTGLFISLILAVVGIKFAAVGSVMIYPMVDLWGHVRRLSRKDMMYIALAGPLTNIFLSVVSLVVYVVYQSVIFLTSAYINMWLALFNLFPIPPLDGSRIFFYNWKLWAIIFFVVFLSFSYLSYIF